MPLYHIHNRELVRLRPYDGVGRLRSEALQAWSRFLRCAHTGEIRPIHWRLLVVLYELWLHFGQPQVTVFSGNRPERVARLKTSRHVIGQAIDFNFNGIPNQAIRDHLLKRYDRVGVGYYPNSWHLHLDVRPEKSFWIDNARSGEDAAYSKNPMEDLRTEARRRSKPAASGEAKSGSGKRSHAAQGGGGAPARPAASPAARPAASPAARPAASPASTGAGEAKAAR
jgi:uncharacterized protein YcbK (DUF882 family)